MRLTTRADKKREQNVLHDVRTARGKIVSFALRKLRGTRLAAVGRGVRDLACACAGGMTALGRPLGPLLALELAVLGLAYGARAVGGFAVSHLCGSVRGLAGGPIVAECGHGVLPLSLARQSFVVGGGGGGGGGALADLLPCARARNCVYERGEGTE